MTRYVRGVTHLQPPIQEEQGDDQGAAAEHVTRCITGLIHPAPPPPQTQELQGVKGSRKLRDEVETGRGVAHLHAPVKEEQGDEGQQDARRHKHDDEDGSQHRNQAVCEAEDHVPELDVQGLHVAAEAVDEAPHRLRVEEGHWQPQHLLQQLQVQPAQRDGEIFPVVMLLRLA